MSTEQIHTNVREDPDLRAGFFALARESVPQPVVVTTRSAMDTPMAPGEIREITLSFANTSEARLVSPVLSVTPSEALVLKNDVSTFLMEDIAPGAAGTVTLKLQAAKDVASANQSVSTELKFAYDNGTVYVVTGPVLADGPYETIGESRVSIPKRVYKTVLDYTGEERKGIGFVLPNESSDRSLQSYAMSIDDVEEITGIDFYPLLPDEDEERLESAFSTADWSFSQFVPTGEAPDPDALAYVEDNKAARLKNKLIELFVILKGSVFEYLGIEDIARDLGLM